MEKNGKVYLTLEGLKKLHDEYDRLMNFERPEAAKRIETSIAEGGTDDNMQYEAALDAQLVLEKKIAELESALKKAVLIEENGTAKEVSLGSKVIVESGGKKMEFVLVGSTEADPMNGKISNESPLGKKLVGSKKGQLIEIREREITYKVVNIM